MVNTTEFVAAQVLLITQDADWEPDGRVAGDLGGWGRCDRAEVCGYKNLL